MNILTKKLPVDVLLVVSDIQAVRQIRSALEDVEINDRLHHIGDMYEARDYLRQEQPYQDAPQPGLIILEASLRNQSEIDLLAAINSDPSLADVSVALLTRTPSRNGSFENCLYFTDAISDEPTSLQELAQILSTRKN
jgi:CheY-like chemotaxis protein